MISFFRRALSSWIVLGLLGLIMIAFIVTGIGTPGGLGDIGGGARGDRIATIGKDVIHAPEVTQRVQNALENIRQQQPGLDIATFVNGGGYEETVKQLIGARALELWARGHGIDVTKRLVDGEIASIPAFNGPTGKFDETIYRSVLQQRRLSDVQLRRDIGGDLIRRQLLVPVAGATFTPATLVAPYAALMLEGRSGQIGIVPSQLLAGGAPPSDAEIANWYSRNIARYTVPERRVIRYALFGADQLKARAAPTEAEIAAFYKANAASYGAVETRSFSQVVLPDAAAAKALAARIAGGESFAAAAAKAGFTPADTALGQKTQAELAELGSAAIAAAAFATPAGRETAPMKSELGWHIVHVDAVRSAAARPLSAVRAEIVASLTTQKTAEAIADMVSAIESAIADGSTFDDVVKSEKLTVVTTPPVLASGAAPDAPGWAPTPQLMVLLRAAFQAEADEDPSVETIGNGAVHAVLDVARIIPAAPAPLASIRAQVIADASRKRASDRARAVAQAIVAKADRGVPLALAIAQAGVPLPAPRPATARRLELVRAGAQVPPPLELMFTLAPGRTKLLAAPNDEGWFVVRLDTIVAGDIAKAPGIVEATRNQFTSVIGQEYVEQFTNAIGREIGIKRDPAATARLKAQLLGGSNRQ
jgi:peptidyl-prolyl cis-trans isomerase D